MAKDQRLFVLELGEWVSGIPRCLEEKQGLFRIQVYHASPEALDKAQSDLDDGKRRLRAWLDRVEDYQRDVDRERGRRHGRAGMQVALGQPTEEK